MIVDDFRVLYFRSPRIIGKFWMVGGKGNEFIIINYFG